MGILYEKTMELKYKRRKNKTKSFDEYKRDYVLEELHKMNVTTTEDGQPIENLSYERLKEELVLATFRQIDITADANEWF